MIEGVNLRYSASTFVNVKMYPQYNNNITIKIKLNLKSSICSGIPFWCVCIFSKIAGISIRI
jgi:hypothetical protein